MHIALGVVTSHLGFEVVAPLGVVEELDELEEGLSLPLDAVRVGHRLLEELAEELELWDVA